MGKKSILLLSVFNGILLAAAWIMSLYAYPRLPRKIPLWLNFFGQQDMMMKKSPLFFLYPVIQIFFFLAFLIIARIVSSRSPVPWKAYLLKESIYLVLIFVNLIFIHIQRSFILLAHNVEQGVHKFYFYSLFVIILALIPYYRMRAKLCLRRQGASPSGKGD